MLTRLEARARECPDAIAITAGTATVTYEQLTGWARRIASRLLEVGVGPEVPVAILAGRSAAEIVAQLAVLKAGGCFVPLDPEHPASRLRETVRESGARVLLAEAAVLAAHPALREDFDHLFDLEAERLAAEKDPEPRALPPTKATPDNLAYVIYTSGSTGKPKGVEVTRGNLESFVDAMIALHRIGHADRSSRFASPAFDASIWEIWPFLTAGASLHLAERETVLSPRRLIEWLTSEGITLCFVTTALGEALLAERWPAESAMRTLLIGGEKLRLWAPADLPFALHNHYGPTEATVFTTGKRVSRPPRALAEEAGSAVPPIGPPLEHMVVRLLSPRFEVIDAGELGEICIGGAGVARGYRGRPALTAAAWMPDPAGEPGDRLYRSGDLGRRLPNGDVDFLGRRDHQVKIRGFRVEPGEIEAVLLAHPRVAMAAVVVVGGDERPSLVCFAAPPEGGRPPTASDLRSFLAERVPAAMVPSSFVIRERLPLTPNLKADRRALESEAARWAAGETLGPTGEELTLAPATPGQPVTAARGRIEERLAAIYGEVLGLATVARDDDFLVLGGHSLLVTRVCSRVRAAFGVDLTIAQVYESPSPAELASRIEGLIEELTSAEGASLTLASLMLATGPIEPLERPAGADLPLSFAQERLWFLDRFLERSPIYNVPFEIALDGELEPAALAAALAEVTRRHEVLRSAFVEVEGRPVARVAPSPNGATARRALPAVDLSGCDSPAAERAARRLEMRLARRPFDLAHPSLSRFVLVRRDRERHALLGSMHHIVCDGWSMTVLLGELSVFYRQARARRARGRGAVVPAAPAEMAPLPLQYADYAGWQRRALTGPPLERQLAHWRQELSGAPSALELLTDRPRPAVESTAGGRVVEHLVASLCSRLDAYGRATGSSRYVSLFSALATLLARHARVSDLVIGCPIANRNRLESEGLIGFFVNTLPVRARLDGEPSFLSLTAQIRDRMMEAHEHQDLPFERLVEELAPQRGNGLNPLVSVLFVLQNTPAPPAELAPDLTQRWRELPTGESIADLSLSAEERGGEIELTFDYRSQLWDETSVRRLAGAFRRLLTAAVTRPELSIVDLPLTSEAERHQLRHEWNDTAWAPAEELFVHRLVEARAAAAPGAVAVVAGDRRLTYGELEEQAESLARGLRRLGVGPERRVALWLERSPELLIAMLAVFKAGGAFVPLDPVIPDRRGAEIVADAGAVAVIFKTGVRRELGRFAGTEIELDAEGWRIASQGEAQLEPAATFTPDNLAYVIFTSGSTGRPKGVAVCHRTLSNLVAWYRAAYALTPEDRSSTMSGPAFDATLFEVWPALSTGGRLEIVDEETRLSPSALVDWLARRAITVSWVPTPVAEAIFAAGLAPAPSLRHLQTAGDRLHRLSPEAARWPLINNYGPTEATVCTTYGQVKPDPSGREPSIGRPILGITARVLDSGGRLAPIGAPGELCLGGRGVTRGYLGKPSRTAWSFVPDPFAAETGARMYRSGDLARLRAEGEIEFLGRIDTQVKIRGVRIELGEIESRLVEHPGVREAAVITVVSGAGPGLVAFTVSGAVAADPLELASYLGEKLPEYMVPATFLAVESLPLLPSAKIDRKALAALAATHEPARGPRREPETALQQTLAAIWGEVLNLGESAAEGIGLDDDFFSLGGHSLVGVQVQSRIRSALGVDLPLRALFRARTLAALAERIEALAGSRQELPAGRPARTISRRPAGAAAPPSFAQSRLWFLDRLEPGSAVYNVPMAIHLTGTLRVEALEQALREIERRHESVRTIFTVRDGDPYQVVVPPSLRLPRIDFSGLPAARREGAAGSTISTEARGSFDLAAGPLVRARLFSLAADRHTLLITLHHITSDGWSTGALLRELQALYPTFAAGEPSPLAELPIQYADFSLWQRDWLSGAVLDELLAFWLDRFATLPPALDLPTDRPRPPVRSLRGDMVARPFAAGLGPRLAELGNQYDATPFMVLHAAFSALLGRYSQQELFTTGSPIAGRQLPEVEALIGFFANTLVLTSDLGGEPTFAELVRRTAEGAIEAYAHQALPFERLVEALGVERDLSRSPLFNVALSLDTEIPYRPRFGGNLTGQVAAVHTGTSKFDASLFVHHFEGEITAEIEFATELFDRATVERMLAHFETLLTGALAAPESAVWSLPLLTVSEREELQRWESPAEVDSELPAASSLFALVASQAAKTPSKTALIAGEERLSYAELMARVELLSGRLTAAGLGPDRVVAVLLPRDSAMVVAMLAAHATGGAYLPLDPAYPVERLAYMLADSHATVLVTLGSLAATRPPAGPPVIDLEEIDWAPASPRPADKAAPVPDGDASALSHLIYTSGSTGRPKGVAISQGSAVAMVRWASGCFGEEELSGALAATSICFDLSVFEIFLPLATGGTVILADDALALRSLPARDEVRLVNTVPSALTALLRLDGLPAGVKTVNLAGEPLPRALADAIYALPTVEKLYNLYGPSEDTTYSTFDLIERASALPPTIGRPIAGTSAYVVDGRLRRVVPGTPGELLLGGVGLARCYLGRPRLTAASFIPDRLSGGDGARLYRTGDRVRVRRDGRMDFLGRIDRQVKLRGFRIELGEVELALARCRGVRAAAAGVVEITGEPRLAAWVVTADGVPLDGEELRRDLLKWLPTFMAPSTFVFIEALPLTRNGKIDRAALPSPDAESGPDGRRFVAPRTPIEELVASLWAEALGLEKVSVDASFFELGGHSLAATKVIARLEAMLDLEIPLKVFFEAPTIELLVVALDRLVAEAETAGGELGEPVAQVAGAGRLG